MFSLLAVVQLDLDVLWMQLPEVCYKDDSFG